MTTTETTKVNRAPRSPLRLLLFGQKNAGKSSLLAALGQIQQDRPDLFKGELDDCDKGLARHREMLYDSGVQPSTEEELVHYPIRYRRQKPNGRLGRAVEAVLLDCNGEVAAEIAVGTRGITHKPSEDTLCSIVWDADVILLAVDSSATDRQLKRDFQAFGSFLKRLEEDRRDKFEATGLPVFLVLTKCDKLAQPGDGISDWVARVDDRKQQLEHQLETVLNETPERATAFGRVDVHPWATAIRRPALGKKPAGPKEPYGVVELLWQTLEDAQVYRHKRRRSNRRVRWTMSGLATLVSTLFVMIIAFLIGMGIEDRGKNRLEKQLDSIRTSEGAHLGSRLHAYQQILEDRKEKLLAIRNDPEFEDMRVGDRNFVNQRIDELKVYLPWLKAVANEKEAIVARNDADLKRRLEILRDLKPPVEGWNVTGAGILRAGMIDDLNQLGKRADEAELELRERRKKVFQLWAFEAGQQAWPLWHQQVDQLLKQLSEPLKATQGLRLTSQLTDVTILNFDRVAQAKSDYDQALLQLKSLQNLSSALGLGPSSENTPPVLVIPQKGITLEEVTKKLEVLKAKYPEYPEQFQLDHIPQIKRKEIVGAVQTYYERLLEPGQNEVRKRLQTITSRRSPTAKDWQKLGKWVTEAPSSLSDWRQFAQAMTRMFREDRPDPVAYLGQILSNETVEIKLEQIFMTVPRAGLSRPKYEPRSGQRFEIRHNGRLYSLDKLGAAAKDDQGMHFTFQTETPLTLRLRHGDTLTATLKVRRITFPNGIETVDAGVLRWARGQTKPFPLGTFREFPRFHLGQNGDGTGKEDRKVLLKLLPESGIPSVPDLLPGQDD